MTPLVILALGAFLLAACMQTGPIFPASDKLDPWVSAPASIDPLSDQPPLISDETVHFRLSRGQRRSLLRTGREWGPAQTYLFGFDLRLDHTALGGEILTLSRLLRIGTPEADIVSIKLDRNRGLSVFGTTCIAAKDLGTWHNIEIRINLADDDTGYLEVFCDRRPIIALNALRTTQPPICRRSEGCNTPAPRPARFEWQLGLLAPRPLARATALEMRRIFYHRLFVIPNRVITADIKPR